MMPPRRKKWTEVEEKTLIDKYGSMVADGTLAKMKTREKKFKPIACHVNSFHNFRDPIAYPWQWTWKDVSTKVQNMRHQYLLVKQKIKKPGFQSMENSGGESDGSEYDWEDGLTHWSNFLRYKEVFGDLAVSHSNSNDLMTIANDRENGSGFLGVGVGLDMVEFGQMGHSGDGDFAAGLDGVENGVMGFGFDYDGEEGEVHYNGSGRMREDRENGYVYEDVELTGTHFKKKRKVLKGLEKKAWRFLGSQLGQLREMEARFEQRDLDREQERQRRENFRMELEQEWQRKWEEREKEREEQIKDREKSRRQRICEWEDIEKESEEMEIKRREEELACQREWEDRMNSRRSEWKKRVDEMLSEHHAEKGQIQNRILHEQQNLTTQLLGIVSQWTAHPAGLSDHTSSSSHYLSQMMQNLQHVNGIVHGDTRADGDNQEDQFIVDG
ncbi:stress response protein NST1-like [Quillaja saponaria]|uniref:Stress response protein NST1-like n=1 Tax=Quillaja saponaria TaxID=32244 RepID=A0AAD7QGQ3_QUISA|nr:stress response protein NST1-like [Quillaja saponaria]KAJ7980521.1 stress response protein NST1-like [Quillaja saponaria]